MAEYSAIGKQLHVVLDRLLMDPFPVVLLHELSDVCRHQLNAFIFMRHLESLIVTRSEVQIRSVYTDIRKLDIFFRL